MHIFKLTIKLFFAIYAMFLIYYFISYDYVGSGHNWSIYFESAVSSDSIYDTPIIKIDKFTNELKPLNLNFSNGNSVELIRSDKFPSRIYCEFNNYKIDYPYSEFKTMNDSIKSILIPCGYTEIFSTQYNGLTFSATDAKFKIWFFMRDFNDALVKKTYISVLPLAILLAVLSWYRKNRTQKESDE